MADRAGDDGVCDDLDSVLLAEHPSFGEGVVARLSSATVCEVVFVKGTVKLIMGAGSTTRTPGS